MNTYAVVKGDNFAIEIVPQCRVDNRPVIGTLKTAEDVASILIGLRIAQEHRAGQAIDRLKTEVLHGKRPVDKVKENDHER